MKYFKQSYYDSAYGEFTLSHEAIDPQQNDPIIDQIASVFEYIGFKKNENDPLKPQPTREDINSGLKEINKLLKERFGILINVINNNHYLFCTYPISFKINNVLNPELINIASEIDAFTKDDTINTSKDVESLNTEKDEYKIIKTWALNFKNALKDNRLNNVSIDLKKAYVSGLPEIYKSYIILDIGYAFSLNLTSLEMTAILLHEYGHNFTTIENTYRHIQNTTILLDSLRSEVGQKGKTVRAALKLTYEKIFKESVSSSATSEQILTDWLEQEAKLVAFSTSKHAYTDSEALADQFATRFGVGPELTSALNKIINSPHSHNYVLQPIVMLEGILLSMSASLFYIWLVNAIGIGLLLNPVMLAVGAIITFILTDIFALNSDFETSAPLTYDTLYKRYQRVKLDLIRQIRTIEGIDIKFKNRIIEDIELVEKNLKNVKLPSTAILHKLMMIFSSNKRRAFDMKRSQQLMEELSENDLYIASNKIQQFV